MSTAPRGIGLAACCLFWAGLVSGISFLESWVKFRAPSLAADRTIGFEVGREVFGAMQICEAGLCLLAIICFIRRPPGRMAAIMLAIIIACLSVQAAWLKPALDARIAIYLGGGEPPASVHHLFYGIAEVLKVGVLLALAATLLRRLSDEHESKLTGDKAVD